MPTWGTKGLPSGPRADHQGVGLVARPTHHASRARHVMAVGWLVTRVICVCAKGLEIWCKGPRVLVQGASSFGEWKMPTWGPKGLPSGPRADHQGVGLVTRHTHHASRARHVTAVGWLVTRVFCVCAKGLKFGARGLEFWCKGPRVFVNGKCQPGDPKDCRRGRGLTTRAWGWSRVTRTTRHELVT